MSRFQSPRVGALPVIAAIVLICGAAIIPFLHGVMPETADGTIHLYRLPILDHAMQDGSLWPRFPVATVYGYGSPLFNFYSPLSLYPMHALHLAGLSYTQAWLFGMAFYIVVAGLGMYLLMTAWVGSFAGVVAAAAYVYAPYFVYDALWRGTTSETAALAILPWVLWAIKLLADAPSRQSFVAVVLSTALFMPMHNITTVLGGALIGGYGLFVVAASRSRRLALIRVFGALMLGLLLAAFYWYPAIRETPNIKIDAITSALPDIDVTRNLRSAWESFAVPVPADPSRQQALAAVALGWPQLLMAALGMFGLRRMGARLAWLAILSAAAIAGTVFMTTPASEALWRVLPLIGYTQYPTRLLGLASLLLGVMAGISAAAITSRAVRWNGKVVAVVIPVAAMVLWALPMTTRTPLPEHQPKSVVDALDFEVNSGFVGSSSFGEYVPVWTAEFPDQGALRDRYAVDTFISRLTDGDTYHVEAAEWRNTWGRVTVEAERPTTLTFDWLYLPYWQATVNGESADVRPSPEVGLVQVDIEAGRSTVEIGLMPSRTQVIATIASAAAILATVGVLGLWPILRGRRAVVYVTRFEAARDVQRAVAAAVIAGILGIGIKLAYDLLPNPLRSSRYDGRVLADAHLGRPVEFADGLRLLDAQLADTSVPAGASTSLTLAWTAADAVTPKLIPVVRVMDSAGRDIARSNDDRPGGLETQHWRPEQYVIQQVALTVPGGTPPGRYTVGVEVYDPASGRALDVLDVAGAPAGVTMTVGEVEVTRGESAPVPESAGVYDLDTVSVAILNDMPETATSGDTIVIDAVWTVNVLPAPPAIRVEWRAESGDSFGDSTLTLDHPFPVTQWRIGDRWRLTHSIVVPPHAVGRVSVMLVGERSSVEIGTLQVSAPTRVHSMPPDAISDGVEWANGIALEGYKVSGGAVTFYWSNSGILRSGLRRFAQVIGESGVPRVIVDGSPARAVTSWLPGEIVPDTVELEVQAGEELRVGWVDPITGNRVELAAGGDFAAVTRH